MIMRIRCSCGNNLADATLSEYNTDFVKPIRQYLIENNRPVVPGGGEGTLVVKPRPNVQQREYSIGYGHRTYTWFCPKGRELRRGDPRRCGQDWKRTAEKIALAWVTAGERPDAPWNKDRGVVIVVLDHDL